MELHTLSAFSQRMPLVLVLQQNQSWLLRQQHQVHQHLLQLVQVTAL
jgi:putative SOS response-associated peptidase YedK